MNGQAGSQDSSSSFEVAKKVLSQNVNVKTQLKSALLKLAVAKLGGRVNCKSEESETTARTPSTSTEDSSSGYEEGSRRNEQIRIRPLVELVRKPELVGISDGTYGKQVHERKDQTMDDEISKCRNEVQTDEVEEASQYTGVNGYEGQSESSMIMVPPSMISPQSMNDEMELEKTGDIDSSGHFLSHPSTPSPFDLCPVEPRQKKTEDFETDDTCRGDGVPGLLTPPAETKRREEVRTAPLIDEDESQAVVKSSGRKRKAVIDDFDNDSEFPKSDISEVSRRSGASSQLVTSNHSKFDAPSEASSNSSRVSKSRKPGPASKTKKLLSGGEEESVKLNTPLKTLSDSSHSSGKRKPGPASKTKKLQSSAKGGSAKLDIPLDTPASSSHSSGKRKPAPANKLEKFQPADKEDMKLGKALLDRSHVSRPVLTGASAETSKPHCSTTEENAEGDFLRKTAEHLAIIVTHRPELDRAHPQWSEAIESAANQMWEEMKKPEPDLHLVKSLMKSTYKYRKRGYLRGEDVKTMLRNFPALRDYRLLKYELHVHKKVSWSALDIKLQRPLLQEHERFERYYSKPDAVIAKAKEQLEVDKDDEEVLRDVQLLCLGFYKSKGKLMDKLYSLRSEDGIPFKSLAATPSIDIVNRGPWKDCKFSVYCENQFIVTTPNFYEAVMSAYSLYWLFNLEYEANCKKFFETFDSLIGED